MQIRRSVHSGEVVLEKLKRSQATHNPERTRPKHRDAAAAAWQPMGSTFTSFPLKLTSASHPPTVSWDSHLTGETTGSIYLGFGVCRVWPAHVHQSKQQGHHQQTVNHFISCLQTTSLLLIFALNAAGSF